MKQEKNKYARVKKTKQMAKLFEKKSGPHKTKKIKPRKTQKKEWKDEWEEEIC